MRRPHLIKDADARRFPPLSSRLGPFSSRRAMEMLRGGHDTRSIASVLCVTESAVWNAIRSEKGDA